MFCNYIPCARNNDGTFAKYPAGKWQQWQTQQYNAPIPPETARGIVCGRVSDSLEVIDFDAHDGVMLYDAFVESLNAIDRELLPRLTVETTPSGGRHIYYRCDYIAGNTVLARSTRKPDGSQGDALIETRGAGGFIKCAPSAGYELIQGTHETAPRITSAERDVLWNIARSFNKEQQQTSHERARAVDVSAADLLREPCAAAVIDSALDRAGFVVVGRRADGATLYGNRNASNEHDVKCIKSAEDNFVYVFASNNIAPLVQGCNTPFCVFAACNNMTLSEAAQEVRRLFPDRFPKPCVNFTPDDIATISNDEPASVVNFYEQNKNLFPQMIVNAVDDYLARSASPQTTLYAFNLLAMCGLFIDTKLDVDGNKPSTRLNLLNIAETASGKDGVRSAMKRLFLSGNKARFDARPKVRKIVKSKNNDNDEYFDVPTGIIEAVTSPSDMLLTLSESATVDRLQNEAVNTARQIADGVQKRAAHGRALCYISIDEASDMLAGNTGGNNPKTDALALFKNICECKPSEMIAANRGVQQKTRLTASGLDVSIIGPTVSAALYAPLGIEEHLKTNDFKGGFVNRFGVVIGDERAAVVSLDPWQRHEPDAITRQEVDTISAFAVAEHFHVETSEDVKQYTRELLRKYTDEEPDDKQTADAVARLRSRFLGLCALTAIVRQFNADTMTEQGTAATCDNYEDTFAQYAETVSDEPPRVLARDVVYTISKNDVDFAVAVLRYFRTNMLTLCARTVDENADKRTIYNNRVEMAIINAVKSSRAGLRVMTLRNNAKYGLKPYKLTIAELRKHLDELVDNGILKNDEGKYRLNMDNN